MRATSNDVGQAVKGEVIWGKEEDSAERNVRPVTSSSAPTTGQYKTIGKTFPTRQKALRAATKEWKALKKNKAAMAAWVGVKAKYDDRNPHASGEVSYGKADDEKRVMAARRQGDRDAGKLATDNAFDHSADNVKTLRHVYSSKANANRAARAEWRKLQRGMATFSISLAIGIPELFPETPVTVRGFKPPIDSTDWIVTKVTNTIGEAGYAQRIELEIKATEIPD